MSTLDAERPQPTLWQLEHKLRHAQDITAADVHVTLQRCFQLSNPPQGALISEAMERCELSEQDLEDIKDVAIRGIIDIEGSMPGISEEKALREQAEYAHIIGRAGLMLEEQAIK